MKLHSTRRAPARFERGRSIRGGRARPFRGDAGFTLLEMLVVLGIIALLAAVVGPRVVRYFSQAKSQTTQVQIGNISSALELHFLDTGTYPSQEIGLRALVEAPPDAAGWNGPYLKNDAGLIDPWGRPYRYRYPGEHGDFDIYSFGLDDVEGGEGESKDVTSWTR